MNMAQLPFVVEALIVLAALVLGVLLKRKGKPYGKVKLGFHLFFFLWMSMGYYYIGQTLFTAGITNPTQGLVALAGVALVVQLVTGVTMLFRKPVGPVLPKVHGTSALILLLANVAAVFTTGAGL